MKKILSTILVLTLTLGFLALTVSAAELENLAKDATLTATAGDATKAADRKADTAWVADKAAATITMETKFPLPMGYMSIDFGDVVPTSFAVNVSSDAISWTEVYSSAKNTEKTLEYEWTAATQRYLKIDIYKTEGDKAATVAELIVRENKTKEATGGAGAYPSSGAKIPEGSYLINGERIGNKTGWGDNPDTGCDKAFDGDVNTFFDPLGTGDGFAGIDAGEEMTLTKIVIHPRSANLPRFNGAQIDGSNDPDFAEYTTIYLSGEEAATFDYIEIEADELLDSGSYRYFRYFNTVTHGDVAEVELYGEAADGVYEAGIVETEAPETEAEVVEVAVDGTAPQTFDAGVIAAVAAVISAAGYAVSKKRR